MVSKYGPLVKRSRHHPFTVVTGVRFPYGSPLYGSIAQLGEHLPYKQRVTGSSPVVPTIHGSVAQLVRVPACHAGSRGFEPLLSRHISGPLVKRSRHHPFTVVTGVRFPYGSPLWEHSSAGRASALQAEGHRFEPCCSHHIWLSSSVG